MTVTVAKSAGFCFGVKKAVSAVYREAESHDHVFTMGPIIHNEIVIRDLADRGVRILREDLLGDENGEPLPEQATIIIRSHGIPKELQDRLQQKPVRIIDATCPFVKKIHNIVAQKSREGYGIVIIGDPDHPEVRGIRGWAGSCCCIVMTTADAAGLSFPADRKLCVVSQTTFNYRKFQELVEIIKGLGYDVEVMNTICNATKERQVEAMELAAVSDVMLVIGGKNSSNTQKLYDICMGRCARTYFISTPDDLREICFADADKVGITAGASTPNTLIQEVSQYVRRAEL